MKTSEYRSKLKEYRIDYIDFFNLPIVKTAIRNNSKWFRNLIKEMYYLLYPEEKLKQSTFFAKKQKTCTRK